MCNKDLNWTFLTLKKTPINWDLFDLENNNGGTRNIPEKLHDAILLGNI